MRGKELRALLASLQKQEFQIRYNSNHYVVRSPDGRSMAVIPASGSDYRGRKNTLARLKRMGFKP